MPVAEQPRGNERAARAPIKATPPAHIEDLRAQARLARERYQLYKARTLGQRPTSEGRLRELQRAHEQHKHVAGSQRTS